MTAFTPLPGAVTLTSGTPLVAGQPSGAYGVEQPGLIGRAIDKVKSIFGGGVGSTDARLAEQMLAQQAQTLPANATQLPNATVYSYDAAGNPAVAGLAGLSPQMQQQFGISPSMVNGLTQGVDSASPQVNATNQTSVPNGMGMGTAVPVLGQPILNLPTATDATGAPKTPAEIAAGTSQVVRNSNTVDQQQEGYGGYGGWGGSVLDPTGGVATPYTPYGPSMTGAYGTQGGVRGFFSRLLGG